MLPISYDKLWKLLIDRKMNKSQLKKDAGLSSNIIAKMGKNQPVSLETLVKICQTLSVNIEDIITITEDNK
ncbi:helix-turn-helix domain-containing protein [Streptococcus ictaluri]|uniref:HTH cro/C1-type domain-containing protein n=1 Tax=Streptococcus ictaluri 707-05 TaxID=764299 RepID=G5K535_9STRE|nr:helix-turn-helix transcriptional regulator [Streptococcus ictaluri]EHI69279.1 hypothetical protein STRIC_1923 [Streptococcus ictaluri 707-05]